MNKKDKRERTKVRRALANYTKPKTRKEMRAELAAVRRALDRMPASDRWYNELYGAQQALCWALGDNAMAPAKLATLGSKEEEATEPE